MAALMILQQLGSGFLLGFFYEPLPVQAYESVQHIQQSVFLGQLIRNLHHWTGHLLIIVVFLHMLRVFLNGAFYPPRHRNWLVGLGLGALILLANFSGYLLPWDQLSYWAVTIASSMLTYVPFIGITLQEMLTGGGEVGAETLQLFYFIHTTIIPGALFLLMAYHFWYVRKAGGVLVPLVEPSEKKSQTVVPGNELLIREVSFAALVSAVLLLFAMFVNAPLGEMANPGITPTSVKAPWYFLGAQELLLHVHPLVAVCILPLAVSLFLLFLPLLKNSTGKPGFLLKIVFLGGTLCLLILTVTGIWFRGPGMTLVWPW
jgi:quinol-cytochrome oxidoreductase complex cytochrome b subunit